MNEKYFKYNGITYDIIEVYQFDKKCERCDFYNKYCFYLCHTNNIPECTYGNHEFIFVKSGDNNAK